MPTTPTHPSALAQQTGVSHAPSASHAAGSASAISRLRDQAEGCRRCPLWRNATQTVFGEGPDDAALVFVGEQPGDQEDLAGRPFVGPAGKMFNAVLGEAAIERRNIYVTAQRR